MSAPAAPFTLAAIAELAVSRGNQPVWSGADGDRTWKELGARIAQVAWACSAAGVAAGEVTVVPGEAAFDSLAWGLGAALAGAVVAPLHADRAGELAAWSRHLRVAWKARADRLEPLLDGRHSPRAEVLLAQLRHRRNPGLLLATGGTTGTPKLLLHDLTALLAGIPVRNGPPWRTLPLMRFDHIGGLDMAWRALAGGQILVAPPPEVSPRSVAATVERHRVEVLAATPSFLNLFLLSEVSRRHDLGSLRIVPYGAEPMPAGLLGRLRKALPAVDFVQRFGTSETGALPVRPGDGGMLLRAGIPGYGWRVVDGELWVRSPARALGYVSGETERFAEDGWYHTGDLAEVLHDGSVRVLGRIQEMINVGGEKVLPDEVEDFLLSLPQVTDCRVSGVANAVLGQVVAAEIVWQGPERDPIAVRRILQELGSGRIARHKIPVTVRLVDAVAATRTGKKLRVLSA